MNEMYTRIESLCKKREINITQMCRDAEIPRGNLTDLKKGRTAALSTKTLVKISEYFGVSVEYLLGAEQKEKTPAETGGGISFPENVPYINEDEASLLNLYRELNQEGKEKLYGYADDLVSSGKYIKTDSDRMVQGKK